MPSYLRSVGDYVPGMPLSGDYVPGMPLSGDYVPGVPLSGDYVSGMPLSGDYVPGMPLVDTNFDGIDDIAKRRLDDITKRRLDGGGDDLEDGVQYAGITQSSKPPPGGALPGNPFGIEPEDSKKTDEDSQDESSSDNGEGGSEYGADTVIPEISAPKEEGEEEEEEEEDEEEDKEEDTTLKDASLALDILSKVVDLTKNLFKVKADIDFKNGMDKAQKNISEGQNKMINSGEGVNNALNGLSDANSKYTDFANQFSQIQSTLSSQLANIASMTGDLSGLNAQLSNQTAQLNQAQSRLDQAIARTDLTLPQKRVEIRSANYDLMQANLAVNDTNFNLANVTESLNSAGAQYNQTFSEASGIRSNLTTSYAQSQAFQNALNANVAQYNQGAQQFSQGVSGAKDVAGNYKNTIDQLSTVAEASAGASGMSKILGSIDNGKYAQATGDALLSGVDAYARNGGPSEISMARGLIGAGINSASQAVDGAFASGNWTEIASNFTKDFGQATLRTNDMQRVGQNIDLAYSIMNNTSNPNRAYNAGEVLVQQIGPISQISSTITKTVSTIIPGAQGISPAVEIIIPSLGVGLQGAGQTLLEAGNKLFTQGLSATVGDYPSLGIGRGLVVRESGGPTSPVSDFVFGSGVSIASTAKQAVLGSATGQNFAMETSATIKAIANTGLPSAGVKTQVSAGSVTFKTDSKDISIRPPSADPVGGATVAF